MHCLHRRRGLLAAALLSLLPVAAFAQTPGQAPAPMGVPTPWKPDSGDTAWMLVSTALVLLMTPGLAFFYGGMVRRKNVLGTLMQSFIAMGVITVVWIVAGYSLAFGKGNAFIGGLDYIMLNDVGTKQGAPLANTIPHQLYMAYQMMFAIITPALISGAFAERMKFSSYLVLITAWSLLIYSPIAHWVWHPDGWLAQMHALDFAGGTVVHISSGVSALVCALYLGKRRGYPNEEMRPHNLTMTLVGTGLLWFGWFGFNGGSAVASNDLAVAAFVNTHIATAVAMMAWVFVEWAHRGKPTALGAASGAVAGLVGITPAAGFVEPTGAIAIGAAVAVVCYLAVMYKGKFGYDDTLDTFGVHGVGGTVGALLTGVFCVAAVQSGSHDGLIKGAAGAMIPQLAGVAATWAIAAVGTLILLFLIDKTIGLRMKSTDEEVGMDVALHGEEGYVL